MLTTLAIVSRLYFQPFSNFIHFFWIAFFSEHVAMLCEITFFTNGSCNAVLEIAERMCFLHIWYLLYVLLPPQSIWFVNPQKSHFSEWLQPPVSNVPKISNLVSRFSLHIVFLKSQIACRESHLWFWAADLHRNEIWPIQ